MDKKALAQVLRKLRFTAELPDPVLERLAAAARVRGYPRGAHLFQETRENQHLMIVWLGSVALDMQVPGHESIRILTAGPGDVIGWSALLGNGKMTTSATALEDTQIVAFTATELQAACESNHSLGYFLMNKVAVSLTERLLDTRKQLIDMITFDQAVNLRPKSPR
jgi:CRP/FNR family transcriptional regulator, cyclic AMP receptor protein